MDRKHRYQLVLIKLLAYLNQIIVTVMQFTNLMVVGLKVLAQYLRKKITKVAENCPITINRKWRHVKAP